MVKGLERESELGMTGGMYEVRIDLQSGIIVVRPYEPGVEQQLDVVSKGTSFPKKRKGEKGKPEIQPGITTSFTGLVLGRLQDEHPDIISFDPGYNVDFPVETDFDPNRTLKGLIAQGINKEDLTSAIYGRFGGEPIADTPLGRLIKGTITEQINEWQKETSE